MLPNYHDSNTEQKTGCLQPPLQSEALSLPQNHVVEQNSQQNELLCISAIKPQSFYLLATVLCKNPAKQDWSNDSFKRVLAWQERGPEFSPPEPSSKKEKARKKPIMMVYTFEPECWGHLMPKAHWLVNLPVQLQDNERLSQNARHLRNGSQGCPLASTHIPVCLYSPLHMCVCIHKSAKLKEVGKASQFSYASWACWFKRTEVVCLGQLFLCL